MLLSRLALPLAVAFLAISLGASPVHAASDIQVMHPWARPTIPKRPGVTYFGIHNMGDTADRLIGAHAKGVAKIEIHKAEQKNGIMTMALAEAVEIPAGGMAHLEPGGFHLMMFGIDPPLKLDDTLEMTLIFEGAGEVAITVPVTKTMGDPQHKDHGNMGSGTHQHGTHQHGATSN